MEKRTFDYWYTFVWPKDKELNARLGQSFVNHFGFTQMPELFYSNDEKETMKLINGLVDQYQLR